MLNRIYQYITTHKLATFPFFTAWALIAIYGLSQLRFEEDITKVLPQNDKTNLTSKVLKQLNFADKILVMVTAEKGGTLTDLFMTMALSLRMVKRGYRLGTNNLRLIN